jgi:hypothetical protein
MISVKRSGVILVEAQVGIKIQSGSEPEGAPLPPTSSSLSLTHNGAILEASTVWHQSCLHHHSIYLSAMISVDAGDTLQLQLLIADDAKITTVR